MTMELRRPERTFTIRQLCLEFGCTPRALRFYEDKGLLSPAREGLNRVYSNRDRVRLTLILHGKRVGLSLSEIREILDLYKLEDGAAKQYAQSLRKFQERIVALEAQREDIDKVLGELHDVCRRLEHYLGKERPELLPAEIAAKARLDAKQAAAAK
jgi:DNA-binding transcriptional MerR regulator